MFEMLFVMIAAAANAGAQGGVSSGEITLAAPNPALEAAAEEPVDEPVAQAEESTGEVETANPAPTFLAPPKDQDSVEQSAPATAFLAPSQDNSATEPSVVAPSFLAPALATSQTAAAPAFLAPQPAQPAAAPTFLAPSAQPGLVAEPQVPSGRFTTAIEVKPILTATRANWIAVREYNGKDLLYVTHLWSWRCGLLEMRVGINGNPPEVWPLPKCHLDQQSPAAILEGDGLPYGEFALGSLALIEVEITYDDLTKDRAKFNRNGRLVP